MKRSAFTLVELLVVIAVIIMLVAILIPAVSAAREYARRNQCLSQQRSLVLAVITYDKESDGLPGSLDRLGTTPLRSWVVSILPLIGEQKRYDALMSGLPLPPEALVSPPVLLCPSDSSEGDARLNYVVNCGPAEWNAGINGDNAPYFTLCRDRRRPNPSDPLDTTIDLTSINKKVKIEDIPDGASNTILLTENLDAGVWYQDWRTAPNIPNELPTGMGVHTRNKNTVANLGFIWAPLAAYQPNATANGPVPRPSSKHPNVVIAAFADGTARAINNDISQREWLRAVCPDDEKAREPFNTGGLNLP